MTDESKRIKPFQISTLPIEELRKLDKYYEKLASDRVLDDLKLISEKSAVMVEILEREFPSLGSLERAQLIYYGELIRFLLAILDNFTKAAIEAEATMKARGYKTAHDVLKRDKPEVQK